MIISICNRKGGVGKSTTAINLSAILCAKGKKVLLIDLDPQRNTTQGFGIRKEPVKNLDCVLRGKNTIQECIVTVMGVDILPASENLKNADADFNSRKRREYMLSDQLETLKESYDYIFIDCQPNMYLLTENALVASDYYLVPLQAEYFAMEGLTQMLKGVADLKKEMRIPIQLAGVFMTRYNTRKKLCRTVAETVRESLKEKFFDTFIRENIAVSEAQAEGLPIFQYVLKNEIESNAAQDYVKLSEELLTKITHG